MVREAKSAWDQLPVDARKWVARGGFVGGILLALFGGAWGGSAMTTSSVGLTEEQVGGIVGDSLRPIRQELAAQRSQGDEIMRHLRFWSCDRSAQIAGDASARARCEQIFRDEGLQ